jgi:hypothetical protein
MGQVETENETNSSLFVKEASMDDGQVVYEAKWDDSSDVEVVKYSMDTLGEAMHVIKAVKAVFIDVIVVMAFFII